MGPRLRIACLLALTAAAVAAPPAAAAPPAPFGHTCAATNGALLCATATDAQRVPSFDGTPLDADVWLPPTEQHGDGPFPTIAMLHGFGGSKRDFAVDAAAYARAGYTVLTPTARGFGRSCGVAASRTAGCEHGWIHLDDQRYEARDVQWLLGRLVDERVAAPTLLGVTGISYGGGLSATLAALRDRVRLPSGAYAPWTSPAGVALRIAAAWARWPWSDLADALVPNGRVGTRTSASPVGVPIGAYVSALYGVALGGYVAPAGADPTSDLTGWYRRLQRGEPYGADVRAQLRILHDYKSALGVPARRPGTPIVIQSGWTDDLFPAWQGIRLFDAMRRAGGTDVRLQLADLGHPRAANHSADAAALAAQARAFFDSHLRGQRALAAAAVTAFTQTCPKSAPRGGGPYTADSAADLARGSFTLRRDATQRVTSSGGDATLSGKLVPVALDPCATFPDDPATGTAFMSARSGGFTLIGQTRVRARVRVRGRDALLVGRLWDVDPARGRQQLIDRGVVRLRSGSSVSFALNGNGWRFAAGHRVKLELVGRDGPTYRPANRAFSVAVSDLRASLPTRERRP